MQPLLACQTQCSWQTVKHECAAALRLVKSRPLTALMQVAGRTNDAAGDGTTTASVLARDMIHYGLQVSSCQLLLCLHVRDMLVVMPAAASSSLLLLLLVLLVQAACVCRL